MVSSDIYGEDAVKAYAKNPDSMAYDCSFIGGLELLTFDGKTISGINGDGETLFSHTYHYIGMEDIRGLYEYETNIKTSSARRLAHDFVVVLDLRQQAYVLRLVLHQPPLPPFVSLFIWTAIVIIL